MGCRAAVHSPAARTVMGVRDKQTHARTFLVAECTLTVSIIRLTGLPLALLHVFANLLDLGEGLLEDLTVLGVLLLTLGTVYLLLVALEE